MGGNKSEISPFSFRDTQVDKEMGDAGNGTFNLRLDSHTHTQKIDK